MEGHSVFFLLSVSLFGLVTMLATYSEELWKERREWTKERPGKESRDPVIAVWDCT